MTRASMFLKSLRLPRSWILVFAALALVWMAIALAVSTWYFDVSYQRYLSSERAAGERTADSIAQNINRSLTFLHGVPATIGEFESLRSALQEFGPDAHATTLGKEVQGRIWSDDSQLSRLNILLSEARRNLGVDLVFVVNAAGDCIAASNADTPISLVGTHLSDREYFREARDGRRGDQYAVGRSTNVPGLFFAAPIQDGGRFIGAVVAKVDIPSFRHWVDQADSFVADMHGVIITASDPALEYRSLPQAEIQRIPEEVRFAIYKRKHFEPLHWQTLEQYGSAIQIRLPGAERPALLTSRNEGLGDLDVFVLRPLDHLDHFSNERWVMAVLLTGIGWFFLATGIVTSRYLQLEHANNEELEHQRNALANTRHMLQLVLDAIPARVFWKDRSLNYLGANSLFAGDAGLGSPDEIVGKSDYDMPWSREAQRYRNDDREVIQSGVPKLAIAEPQTTPDGREIWLETNKIPLREADGRIVGVLGAYQEVTERKRIEADLVEARRTAEDASSAKSRFLANMSHEIRTPMNGVLGMLELLLHSSLEPKQRHFAETAYRSAEALLGVINDVLDFSKIEAGSIALKIREFDLPDLVREVTELLASQAEAARVELRYEIAAGAPQRVSSDPDRLRQILNNLLSNAIKFSAGGSVTLRLESLPECDCPGSAPGYQCLRIAVIDTGIGIAPDLIAKLFRPFQQGDASNRRAFGGTGLGLAISRELAQMLGGDITVESQLGSGSTFRLSLPMLESGAIGIWTVDETPRPDTVNAGIETGSPLTGHRVLVAEDNPVNRDLAVAALVRLGCTVTAVRNGLEAVMQHGKEEFDAILMDIQMPDMDGFEATRFIRQRETASGAHRVPIIAVTASATQGDRELCLEAGMDAHLTKPFRLHDLSEVLLRFRRPGHETSAATQSPAREFETGPIEALRELSRSRGEPLLEPLVRVFIEDANTLIDTVQACWAARDTQGILEAASRLRTDAGHIGAIGLSNLAYDLEVAARSGTIDYAGDAASALRSAFAQAQSFLELQIAHRSRI